MSRNPEEKPAYLQDVIAPKETERAPEGFDLDREFGKGTRERMAKAVEKGIRESLTARDYAFAAHDAARSRILTGELVVSQEELQEMVNALEKSIRELLAARNYAFAAYRAAYYRILTGELVVSQEELHEMAKAVEKSIRERIAAGAYYSAVSRAAYYRILKAHDLTFIPGKGIEIIDTPPPQFQQAPIPPMPEERKF